MIIQRYKCPNCEAELISEQTEKRTVRPSCFSCGRKMDSVSDLDLSKKRAMSQAKRRERMKEIENDPLKHRKKKRTAKKRAKK